MLWQVKDNSGIATVTQLKIKKTKQNRAGPGHLMTVFPRNFKYVKLVKRQTYLGLVIMTKSPLKRPAYTVIGPYHGVILLSHDIRMQGTKIWGLAYEEVKTELERSFRYKKVYTRIAGRYF